MCSSGVCVSDMRQPPCAEINVMVMTFSSEVQTGFHFSHSRREPVVGSRFGKAIRTDGIQTDGILRQNQALCRLILVRLCTLLSAIIGA